jgi:hypothetical protein
MPKFLIDREIPGAGNLSQHQLHAISQKSCGVLQGMGPSIQWVESFVTGDKIYCIYIAPDENTVREHARLGEFPANRVSRVVARIDPTTAE